MGAQKEDKARAGKEENEKNQLNFFSNLEKPNKFLKHEKKVPRIFTNEIRGFNALTNRLALLSPLYACIL